MASSIRMRFLEDLRRNRFDDENHSTITSTDQEEVEDSVWENFELFWKLAVIDPEAPRLNRQRHVHFLLKGISNLSTAYQCLDCSRPWLCFWILHALYLLDETLSSAEASAVAQFLAKCQSPTGGFGGGPGQYAHLATTYAAVNALCILGTEEAYEVIDRKKLAEFLQRVHSSNGSFQMHEGGETDIRGAYCALSVARLTNIYCDATFDNTAQWIVSCQTYEGGFSGYPGLEAHGGYSFCGLAALVLLGKEKLCDVQSLLRWAAFKQMKFEGGFQGRTNKLVDGCYSFWQGGIFPLLHRILHASESPDLDRWLFHQEALQEYLLICCQNSAGGLIDKPGKPRDFYHTCYTLSGLSIAQHPPSGQTIVVGSPTNELAQIHPLHNILIESAMKATKYFAQMPPVNVD